MSDCMQFGGFVKPYFLLKYSATENEKSLLGGMIESRKSTKKLPRECGL